MTPIILLCGESGSGKDTIAGFLAKNHQAQPIAFADPFKRFALNTFGFSEEQLWGPSEARNQRDPRFADHKFCNEVLEKVEVLGKSEFLVEAPYLARLQNWVFKLLKEAQEEGGLTPRKMLQVVGGEWGRWVSPRFWIDRALNTAEDILHHGYGYHRTTGPSALKGTAPDFVCISDGRYRNEILTMRTIGAQVWKVRSGINTNTAVAGVANHASEAEQRSIPDFYYTHILDNDKASGLGALERTVDLAMSSIRDYNLKPEWYSTKITALRGW